MLWVDRCLPKRYIEVVTLRSAEQDSNRSRVIMHVTSQCGKILGYVSPLE